MSAPAKHHFTLAGTPVRVEPFFWIITVLFGFQGGRTGWYLVTWVVVVFVSILVHEMGHAIAYRAFGQSSSVVLHGFGGLTFGQRTQSKKQSIIVSLAGPLTALLLLGLPARFLFYGDVGRDLYLNYDGGFDWLLVLYDVYFVNVWWSAANLVPVRPLDGGHVAQELVGLEKGRIVSIVAGATAAVYAYLNDFGYAGFFFAMLAVINFFEWRRASKHEPVHSTFDVDHPDPVKAAKAQRRRAARLRVVDQSGVPHLTAAAPVDKEQLEVRAWNALRGGDVAMASRLIASPDVEVSRYLRGTVALATGQPDALPLLAQAYSSASAPNLVPAAVVAATEQALPLVQVLLGGTVADGRAGAAELQTNLHYAERYRESALVGEALHAAGCSSPAQTAFEVACAWSQAGDVERSVQWLETAGRVGFRAAALVDGEPDLDAVRRDPRWPLLRAQLG